MATIDEILQREVNPFDPVTFRTGNFWQEQQNSSLTVESIHQEAIEEITATLDRIEKDHSARSLLLLGDKGCGKSYLLSRVKQQLNSGAFFAYIGPWSDRDRFWRHLLRHTVESLMEKPEGQEESQLLLWLKSLSRFKNQGLTKKLWGERGLFISNLRNAYPTSIYQAKEFFGVLYDLTNPELYLTASDWLRGENLDKDDQKAIGVNGNIDTEDAAKSILSNFGRLSIHTQPIVLCFDQIDHPELITIRQRLQQLFNANTTFNNEKLKNFLIIISLVTETWKLHNQHIIKADQDRIDRIIQLKAISLDQAEAIWRKRLAPLHQQAEPKPNSPIYPLNRQVLEQTFPGGKTQPRYALQLGYKLVQEYKTGKDISSSWSDPTTAFKLVWRQEFSKIQKKISRIRQLASPDLIQTLKEVLKALQVEDIDSRLLESQTFASYSFRYTSPSERERIGVVWSEDPNMRSFYAVMKACQKTLQRGDCDRLIFIRSEKLGKSSNQGYKIYQQIFQGSSHRHLTPHLNSVHYLVTYQALVNAAYTGKLVIGYDTPSLKQLQRLVRESQVLQNCRLLQELGAIPPDKKTKKVGDQENQSDRLREDGKAFLLNLVQTQQILGRQTLIKNGMSQFPDLDEARISQLIEQLMDENKIKVVGSEKNPEKQIICLVPQG